MNHDEKSNQPMSDFVFKDSLKIDISYICIKFDSAFKMQYLFITRGTSGTRGQHLVTSVCPEKFYPSLVDADVPDEPPKSTFIKKETSFGTC